MRWLSGVEPAEVEIAEDWWWVEAAKTAEEQAVGDEAAKGNAGGRGVGRGLVRRAA